MRTSLKTYLTSQSWFIYANKVRNTLILHSLASGCLCQSHTQMKLKEALWKTLINLEFCSVLFCFPEVNSIKINSNHILLFHYHSATVPFQKEKKQKERKRKLKRTQKLSQLQIKFNLGDTSQGYLVTPQFTCFYGIYLSPT